MKILNKLFGKKDQVVEKIIHVKKDESNEITIPDGGEFNIYLNCPKNFKLDLNNLKEFYQKYNQEVETDYEDTQLEVALTNKLNDSFIELEKYDFDVDFKKEILEDCTDSFNSKIIENCNSNYYVNAKTADDALLLYILVLYLSINISNIIIYDCYNGCYLKMKDIEKLIK